MNEDRPSVMDLVRRGLSVAAVLAIALGILWVGAKAIAALV